jgi:serine/threonine-protein kinase
MRKSSGLSEFSLKPGDVIAGKYAVERELGQGGMGVVVAARHVDLDERVAIKFILPDHTQNAEVVARFVREAKTAVKIKSEHVARVLDVGRLPTGEPYMVMEFLQGEDLEAVATRGGVTVKDAVLYVLQACEALAEAHSMGIVHRDLKPANLFRTVRADGSPCVKVLDFGLAKLVGAGPDQGMTTTGAMVGTALYMSPEQLFSPKDVDTRTDIWAVGVILFELLTGKMPFMADDMPRLIAQIMHAAPMRVRDLRPDVPEALEAVIARCLEKPREQRFDTIAALAAALAPFAPERARYSADRIHNIIMSAESTERAGAGAVTPATAISPGARPPSTQAHPGAAFPGAPKLTPATAYSPAAPAAFGTPAPQAFGMGPSVVGLAASNPIPSALPVGARRSTTPVVAGLIGGVALLAVCGVGAAALFSRAGSSHASAAGAASSAPAAVTAAAPSAPATSVAVAPSTATPSAPEASAPVAAPEAVSTAPSAGAAAGTAARQPAAPGTKTAATPPTTATPPPPATQKNCTPYYTADGIKHLPPGCY